MWNPRFLLLVLTVFGCIESQPSLKDCKTAHCRQQMILDSWTEDRDQAMIMVGELPTMLERVAAVSRLVDLHPAEVGPLCGDLPRGPSQDRCKRAEMRAHLHVDPRVGGSEEDLSYLAPSERRIATWLQQQSPFDGVAPNEIDCEGAADRSACLVHVALLRADKKDARGAAGLCMAIPLTGDPPERWRSECFFAAAERRLKQDLIGGYADAVNLCAAAKLYGAYCIRHLFTVLRRDVPPGDAAAPEAWAEVGRSATAIEAVWAGSPMAMGMSAELWAVALGMSIRSAEEVTGDAIEYIPAEVLPHLRAAAAARMIEEQPPEVHDLPWWVAAVESALDKRRKVLARSGEIVVF